MKLVKANEGTVYQAPKHHEFWGIKKVGEAEGSSSLSVSISEFLPGGGADMSAATGKDRVYVCDRGRFEVVSGDGTIYSLAPGDMMYIPAGEAREMRVIGTEACRVTVILCSV